MKNNNAPTEENELEFNKQQIDECSTVKSEEIIEFFEEVIDDKIGTSWIDPRGPRSYYESESFIKVLTFASLDQTSLRDASKTLREDIAECYGVTPSKSTVYKTLNKNFDKMDREQVEDLVASIFQAKVLSLAEIRRSQIRNRLLWEAKGIEISIDPHEEVCHFDDHLVDENGNQITMMGQLKENRGRKVFRYCTAAIVFGDDHPRPPLTIGLVIMHKGQSKAEVMKRLFDQIRMMNIKIDLLSCDGEFYSKTVVEYLDNLPTEVKPKRYLIRGRYSKKTNYPGEIGQRFPYDMKAGTKDEYRVEGYLIKNKTPKGDETRFFISSRYNHFHPSEIKRIYKRRFRIENTFRHTRNCKIFTNSDDLTKRIALWAFSHFIELLWEIFRIAHKLPGDRKYRYDLRQKRFLRIIFDYIKEEIEIKGLIRRDHHILRKYGDFRIIIEKAC